MRTRILREGGIVDVLGLLGINLFRQVFIILVVAIPLQGRFFT